MPLFGVTVSKSASFCQAVRAVGNLTEATATNSKLQRRPGVQREVIAWGKAGTWRASPMLKKTRSWRAKYRSYAIAVGLDSMTWTGKAHSSGVTARRFHTRTGLAVSRTIQATRIARRCILGARSGMTCHVVGRWSISANAGKVEWLALIQFLLCFDVVLVVSSSSKEDITRWREQSMNYNRRPPISASLPPLPFPPPPHPPPPFPPPRGSMYFLTVTFDFYVRREWADVLLVSIGGGTLPPPTPAPPTGPPPPPGESLWDLRGFVIKKDDKLVHCGFTMSVIWKLTYTRLTLCDLSISRGKCRPEANMLTTWTNRIGMKLW